MDAISGIGVSSMSYSPNVSELLQRLGAAEGDVLRVRDEGQDRSGTLMPHHEFSHPDVLVLKLKSGYNCRSDGPTHL